MVESYQPPFPFIELTHRDLFLNYLVVKHLHITFAVISGSFFLMRGIWMLLGSCAIDRGWLQMRSLNKKRRLAQVKHAQAAIT